MMPGNVLSDPTIQSPLLEPDSWEKTRLKDFERGGFALNDASLGVDSFNWEAWIDVENNFWVKRVDQSDDSARFQFNRPDCSNIGLAFDRNMNVAICYTTGNNVCLYWFDTSISAYTTTEYGNCKSPAITQDDKRFGQDSIADILLFYIREDILRMRMQRDRYEIEYNLHSVPANYELKRVGMGRNLRLQFVLAPVTA